MGEEMKENLYLVYLHKHRSTYSEINTWFHASSQGLRLCEILPCQAASARETLSGMA